MTRFADGNFFPLQTLTLDLPGRSHRDQAEAACAGGAKWLQFRTKTLGDDARLDEARAVVAVARRHGAIVIMNDTPALARAVGADGVHLGKEDMAPAEARAVLGPEAIIGVTVNSLDDARRVVAEGVADYAGVGPFRFTTSKAKLAPVLTADAFREIIATLAPIPCVIIGGVTENDASAIFATGAAGLAVSSAIVGDDDPAEATRRFLASIARSR